MTIEQERTEQYFDSLAGRKYMLLTTFKRTGAPVSTPVHLVCNGNSVYFRTWYPSGKAKRLRYTAQVEVAPCTMRGRPRGEAVPAHARLLEGDESQVAATQLAHKHPVLHGWLIPFVHRRKRWTTQQYELTPRPDPR